MRKIMITAALLGGSAPFGASASEDISGTYRLVVDQRRIVDTGETITGKTPLGYITYGKEGRMMVIIVRHPRPKPAVADKFTDEERVGLHRTMSAYGGTYMFDGKTVRHNVDIAWNEVWSGITQERAVTREGDRLTLTTPPYRNQTDGKTSVNILVWEKVK
ncbi:MAG TPA: lipocalin-like domain-containing protein [Xanthobacteraceae bacterium]|nr:lipocalin-like domain-containing protein [Xanthobacteraceae bacterium]